MKCTKCGFENASGAKFCGKCGAPLEVGAPAQPTESRTSGAVVHPPRKKLWIPLVCAVVVLAVAVGFFALRGHGGNNTANVVSQTVKLPEREDYLGTWYLNGMSLGDVSGVYFSTYAAGAEMTLEIRDDGTAQITSSDPDGTKSQNSDWTMDGHNVTMTVDGVSMRLRLQKDGFLVGEIDSGYGVIFDRERVEMEPYQPAAPVKADSAKAFAGSWALTSMELNDGFLPVYEFLFDNKFIDIEGTTVTFLFKSYGFDDIVAEGRFEDGALVFDDSDELGSFTLQLLEDGAIQFTRGEASIFLVNAESVESKAYQPAAAVKADSAEAFAGSWTLGWAKENDAYYPYYTAYADYSVDIDVEDMIVRFNASFFLYDNGLQSTAYKARFEDGALVYDGPAEESSAEDEQADFTIRLLADGTVWMDSSNTIMNGAKIMEKTE